MLRFSLSVSAMSGIVPTAARSPAEDVPMAETAQVGQNGYIPAIDAISAEEIGPTINGGGLLINTLHPDHVILADRAGDAVSKKHGAVNRVKCHIEDSQASNVED